MIYIDISISRYIFLLKDSGEKEQSTSVTLKYSCEILYNFILLYVSIHIQILDCFFSLLWLLKGMWFWYFLCWKLLDEKKNVKTEHEEEQKTPHKMTWGKEMKTHEKDHKGMQEIHNVKKLSDHETQHFVGEHKKTDIQWKKGQ